MSALSYFLERESIMTTGISLVRENSESMRPPRALWVPFPLGRPLGKASDADFQQKVIMSALDLLNRSEGPILEDFPYDVPAVAAESAAACPVAFPNKTLVDDSWTNRLQQELVLLTPWYEFSCQRRDGRTLVGLSPQPPAANILRLGACLDEAVLPTDIVWLKSAVEDLRAYYIEAMTAQPGDYEVGTLQAKFWRETALGAAILTVYHQFLESKDNRLRLMARILAPREAVEELSILEEESR